ncbi:MAG TPA: PstS family phosphate ABC transporter substrate-binding protein [Acidobacteriota bacterium]|nr:PstS family phosphate ABC transporter substrate-binding protein [Acidobacteriota bacterium]
MFLLAGASCAPTTRGNMEGALRIDGSSTVYPFMEAVAEEYVKTHPRVRLTVGVSGTGGGFQRFCRGETDINSASRPIHESEVECARRHGVEFIELPVALDGITLAVNPSNDFVDHLTVEELHAIWAPDSVVRFWSDVRPTWPREEVILYGPGADSGTFDYFTEAVNGKSGRCRSDFTASEDDNVLVRGVEGDRSALGFFGFAYYQENRQRVRALAVDAGQGPVLPSDQSIRQGSYRPLSRPLFVYVNIQSTRKREVRQFIDFMLDNAEPLAREVGFVPLSRDTYKLVDQRFSRRSPNSLFARRNLQEQGVANILRQDLDGRERNP